MTSAEDRFRSKELDWCERHPFRGFLSAYWVTDGKFNVWLGVAGTAFIGWGISDGHWEPAAIGLFMLAWLPRNYRRYRQRLFYALAERDRPPGSEPVHPDAADPQECDSAGDGGDDLVGQ
jgi:hypothetical protein